MRRIQKSRISERFVGMRTAGGGGLVRRRAVGADGIPIRFERRSGDVRERVADPEAFRMGKPPMAGH